MQSAKLSILYFVLCVAVAIAAAFASPNLASGQTGPGDSIALDSSALLLDAQIALAR